MQLVQSMYEIYNTTLRIQGQQTYKNGSWDTWKKVHTPHFQGPGGLLIHAELTCQYNVVDKYPCIKLLLFINTSSITYYDKRLYGQD